MKEVNWDLRAMGTPSEIENFTILVGGGFGIALYIPLPKHCGKNNFCIPSWSSDTGITNHGRTHAA
jgi:hypothetical protein